MQQSHGLLAIAKLLVLYGNDKIVAFEASLGCLGATYDVHLRLIGKLVSDFLLVIIELFSLGAFLLSQYTRLTDGETDTVSTAIPCVYASHNRTVKDLCAVRALY